MSWYKNNPNLYVKYGDWNVKGFFKLCNSKNHGDGSPDSRKQ